jgi:transcription initiation factor TFIIIB Brf1 subunit/transcription initiation factor TFIIB|tara:strand:+ start:169 stop:387 length:219 start_codon:yes stop_codon:yes gene_type:complete
MNKADKVYQELLEQVLQMLRNKHSFEMVAAALMAIAQRLYKTHLTQAEYERIMEVARESDVKPYDLKNGTLH